MRIQIGRPKPKMPVFLGCEGQSEVGYALFLNSLLKDSQSTYFLAIEPLSPGAGDPEQLVRRTIQILAKTKYSGTKFAKKLVLIDADKLGDNSEWKKQICNLATENELDIIWQSPCHEAFLLHHMEGQQTKQPSDCRMATGLLKKFWTNYQKPMDARDIAMSIDIRAVRRAASVEPAFHALLVTIGLISTNSR